MPEQIQTGYGSVHWLTQAQYDALNQHDEYGLYFIEDRNRIYRGDKELLNWYLVVNDYPDPYVGDIKPYTFCIKRTEDEIEARVLNEQLQWEVVLPPIVSDISEEAETIRVPNETAVKAFVAAVEAFLQGQIDTLNGKVDNALESVAASEARIANHAASAEEAANNSENFSMLSESYAKGNTGVRPGENIDNAKYYMEKAQEAAGIAQAALEEIRRLI